MAFICFKCKRQILGDAKSLLTHLRLVHHVNHSSTYFQCSEAGCGRTFSFIRSFRRHLLKEHVSQSEHSLDDPLEGPAQPVNIQLPEEVQGDEEVEDEWEYSKYFLLNINVSTYCCCWAEGIVSISL